MRRLVFVVAGEEANSVVEGMAPTVQSMSELVEEWVDLEA
jgi:hypothetical protein